VKITAIVALIVVALIVMFAEGRNNKGRNKSATCHLPGSMSFSVFLRPTERGVCGDQDFL
jgi:L-asparagine transporter-like permease